MYLSLTRNDKEIIDLFKNLKSKDDIANILEIDVKVLNYYLYSSINYKKFQIPKKDNSFRTIHTPSSNIKIIQKKLLYIFNLVFNPHENAFGFIKNKNIVDNALNHTNKKYILNIDLKDFFTTIHFGRIYGYFQNHYNFNKEVSTIISKLVTVEEKGKTFLPQGAPTSPIISNMIAYKLDTEINKYITKFEAKYTRYADDITISSNSITFPKQIAFKDHFGDVWLHSKLTKIIKDNGFTTNYLKVRLRNYKQRQEVTGLLVNTKNPNVYHKYITNIRAILHNWESKGYEQAQERFILKRNSHDSSYKDNVKIEHHLQGKLNFLQMVKGSNDSTYRKLKNRLDKLVLTIPNINNDA